MRRVQSGYGGFSAPCGSRIKGSQGSRLDDLSAFVRHLGSLANCPPHHGGEVRHSNDVIPGDLDYQYDRRVDPDFLNLFDSRGAFRTLTEYACKARYPVDLQFRRNPKTAAQHASLYVGLTTVLNVHWKPGAVKLAAHPTFHPSGFQAAWMSWTALGEAAARAGAVDDYLDAVIPQASAGRSLSN